MRGELVDGTCLFNTLTQRDPNVINCALAFEASAKKAAGGLPMPIPLLLDLGINTHGIHTPIKLLTNLTICE